MGKSGLNRTLKGVRMFNNIIGNEKIKELLINSTKINKISHSYLFVGTEGIGKMLIAKEFAKMILCTNEKKILWRV